MTKPSRKGPFWALAFSLYASGGAFVDAFIDTEQDQLAALKCLPIALACVCLAWWWLERRLKALEAWKDEREMAWWLKDLPEMEG